mgnify:CR=1 FL=1
MSSDSSGEVRLRWWRREPSLVLVVLVVSAALQCALLPNSFSGADARMFLRLVDEQRQPGFWSMPSAFDYNYWAMGYPTFLNGVLTISGGRVWSILVLQVFLGLVLAVICYLLTWSLGRRVRLVALIVAAFSPGVWWMARNGGYEMLLAFLLCSAVALTWAPARITWWQRRWVLQASALGAGVLLGLAVLVQSKALIVFPVLGYLAWRTRRSAFLLQVIGLCAALGPWMIRNALVLGTINPITTNGRLNAWIGNNSANLTGGFMEPPPLPPQSHGMVDAVLRFVFTQPEASLALFGRKAIRLLEPVYLYFDIPIRAQIVVHAVTIIITVVVVAGFVLYLAGRLWLPSRSLPDVGPLACIVVAFYLVHLPFIAEGRFMTPVLPITIAVAVATSFAWIDRMRDSSGRRSAAHRSGAG